MLLVYPLILLVIHFKASALQLTFRNPNLNVVEEVIEMHTDREQATETHEEIEDESFNYEAEKIVGVNLGGWLVTEPFISPSLYEDASKDGTESTVPVDEYHFCQSLGYEEAHRRLLHHWETWITETDIIRIKTLGFNAVRIPIGYWAFGLLPEDPYVTGQEHYLEKAIQWCRTHELKLWIDLHGMPGSQNGFDNSGQRDTLEWLSKEKNYQLGLSILDYIFKKYGTADYEDVVIGIQNLNEPLGPHISMDRVQQFNIETYQMMNKYSHNNFVFHDAFMAPTYWNDKMLFPRTVLDHHRYQCFSPDLLRLSIDDHIKSISVAINEMKLSPRAQIVGEWSAALTDCAKWLNGVGRGTRYENTFQGDGKLIGHCTFANNADRMSEEDKVQTIMFIEAQIDLYSQLNGFFFWTWKTEDAIEWSLSALVDRGLFPPPINMKKIAETATTAN